MASLSTAQVAAMHLCSQCQGYFPSTAALAQHLLEHNMLRALKSDSQPKVETPFDLPPPPPPAPPAPPAPFTPVPSYQQPTPEPKTVISSHSKTPSGTYMPATVEFFDETKGFGFLKRLTPGAADGQVFFHISVCDTQTPLPKRGEQVTFIEKQGPKGMSATSVRRCHASASRAPTMTMVRAPEPVEVDLVHGVVTAYTSEGGFGTIATFNGTSSTALHFSITSCDIKRPPLTTGERVLVTETVGPKGPTAGFVRRITMTATPEAPPKAKPKKQKKPTAKPPTRGRCEIAVTTTETSSEVLLAAVTRAMHMLMSSPRDANKPTTPRASFTAVRSPPISSAKQTAPLSAEEYQKMLSNLSGPGDFEFYLPAAVAMLAHTKPVDASTIQVYDKDTQHIMLMNALENELDLVRLHALHGQVQAWDDVDTANELNFGYAALPSPIAARPFPPPAPVAVVIPEAPRTIYCGVCMDDEPIEDAFVVSGCEHAYCRDSMRTFILGCIDRQDVTPRCPHDGCETVLSDVDLTQVLTAEEQDRYYDLCLSLAAGSVPGLYQCLSDACRGVTALPADDPHFMCPLCPAERCVQCNTREWHEGLTCDQHRQRAQDNELHPEQLRQIYGNNVDVYQCGSCSFGPIERSGCYNLATHHNEAVGGARVNNACPRCGWFAAEIAQWPRWNGQLHAPLPQPAVR